ncbi:MAG: 50S ribosomal protein L23 [Bdellovibrionota bacterium]
MVKVAQDVIVKPLVTEKATLLKDGSNQVVFRVPVAANKIQIRRAVEELFGVKVADVRTMRFAGKFKRRGAFYGKRPNWKKAVVRLQPGSTIDFLAAQ